MTVSYVVGRTGMLDDETGLFVLEGYANQFVAPENTLTLLQGERKLAEFNSQVPYKDSLTDKPQFLNQRDSWFTITEKRNDYLSSLSTSVIYRKDSVYLAYNTRKIASRKYVTQFSGVAGMDVRLKAILRQQGVGTKRVVLFYPGVPRDKGGRTWVVTPHGFGSMVKGSNIWLPSGDKTVEIMKACGCAVSPDFLWLAITNAVPFISNSPVRCSDERYPRFLMTDHNPKTHDMYVNEYVERALDFEDACDLFVDTLGGSVPMESEVKTGFKTELTVGMDESLFCMRELLHG